MEMNLIGPTSAGQFVSSFFPNSCVGSCYDHSLSINGGLTGTPASCHMVSVGHYNDKFKEFLSSSFNVSDCLKHQSLNT